MKLYTTTEQTAKLIELGFERPKFEIETQLCNIKGQPIRAATIVGDYSIGELIKMLPMTITEEIWFGDDKGKEGVWGLRIDTNGTEYGWYISYERDHSAYLYLEGHIELIDALCDMVIRLKEEGVI